MSESISHSHVPVVTREDLLAHVMDEVEDPDYSSRWSKLTLTNPTLMHEIMIRAYAQHRNPDDTRAIINMGVWVIDLLDTISHDRQYATLSPEQE